MLPFSLLSFQSLAVVGSKRQWSSRSFIRQRTCRWRNFPKLCSGSTQLSCSHGGAGSNDRFLFGWYAFVIGHIKRETTWGIFLDLLYDRRHLLKRIRLTSSDREIMFTLLVLFNETRSSLFHNVGQLYQSVLTLFIYSLGYSRSHVLLHGKRNCGIDSCSGKPPTRPPFARGLWLFRKL